MEIRKHVFFSNEAVQLIKSWINTQFKNNDDLLKLGELSEEEYHHNNAVVYEIIEFLKMMGVFDYE